MYTIRLSHQVMPSRWSGTDADLREFCDLFERLLLDAGARVRVRASETACLPDLDPATAEVVERCWRNAIAITAPSCFRGAEDAGGS